MTAGTAHTRSTHEPSAQPLGEPALIKVSRPAGDVPIEIAIPGMHALAMRHASRWMPPQRPAAPGQPEARARALDLGAGQGALCVRLLEMGYEVCACDMFPEMFIVPGVECRRVDVHGALPYESASLDLVCAFEVVEHLESHLGLFREVARVLRPGGVFCFTTPNIMSFKSRLSFLLTGFFYSHGPLDPGVNNPVQQHVAAFTPDRYRFYLSRAGLRLRAVECDKAGGTSRLLAPLGPLVRALARRKHGAIADAGFNNAPAALVGRTMVGIAVKEA